MIKLKNGWQIDSDGKSYIVQQEVTSKEGNKYITNQSYPSSLTRAIQIVMNREQMDVIASNDLTLKEAVQEFKKMHAEFEALLKEVEGSEKL